MFIALLHFHFELYRHYLMEAQKRKDELASGAGHEEAQRLDMERIAAINNKWNEETKIIRCDNVAHYNPYSFRTKFHKTV